MPNHSPSVIGPSPTIGYMCMFVGRILLAFVFVRYRSLRQKCLVHVHIDGESDTTHSIVVKWVKK